MIPLIDCDILLYEIGVQGQFENDEGEVIAKPFDKVADLFDDKIKDICASVWGTEPPILFMSHNKLIHNNEEKRNQREAKKIERRIEKAKLKGDTELVAELKEDAKEVAPKEYKANFREKVGKKKVYKGNRKKNERPLHYLSLVEYAKANYKVVMARGLEADDLLSIYQTQAEPNTTVICSRDKDLKITPGLHYGWETGNQAEFGPELVDELGYINISKNGKKLSGCGLKFFYSQVLTGDVTDNYPGLPKCGPINAYKALQLCTNEEECFNAVLALYVKKYGDSAREEMLEQARLAWMIRELNEDGSPKQWEMYDERA